MVRTPRFHCRGPGSIPGQVTKILQATRHGQKQNNKQKSTKRLGNTDIVPSHCFVSWETEVQRESRAKVAGLARTESRQGLGLSAVPRGSKVALGAFTVHSSRLGGFLVCPLERQAQSKSGSVMPPPSPALLQKDLGSFCCLSSLTINTWSQERSSYPPPHKAVSYSHAILFLIICSCTEGLKV